MKFKLAILNVLAKSPDRRTSLDEVKVAAQILMATQDQTGQLQRFSEFGDIDIFKSGLVERDENGLQITEEGLSLLRSLEIPNGSLPESSSEIAEISEMTPGGMTHDAVVPDSPLEHLYLELVRPEVEDDRHHPSANDETSRTAASPDIALKINPIRKNNSKIGTPIRISLAIARIAAFIAAKKQYILDAGRRHLEQGRPIPPTTKNALSAWTGAAFAILSLTSVVACVVAAISFAQIRSFKSQVAALHREFLADKERIAVLEKIEKTKSDQEAEAQSKPVAKNVVESGKQASPDQTALSLSREEIQLIRDYIKPARSVDPTAPPINVGDPAGGGMIPLPSQLTDKVPRLLGGKFATRNGVVIIVKRASHQVDAVLAPN